MDSPQADPDVDTEAYLRLLAQNERWLATYVSSLVSGSHDADDIIQDVKITLWKQFANFMPDTNFRAWARTIALHRVLNFRRSARRNAGEALDAAFVEAIAAEIDRNSEKLQAQAEALRFCVQKLSEAHRNVIVWRYQEDFGVEEIARRTQRSAEAVYRLLSRIRAVLSECVQRHFAQQEAR